MSISVAQESAADREIVLSRVFDAPRELVWQAWTDPERAAHWWGPRGFTTTTIEHDLRIGGVWRHTMHGPDGRDYPNRKVYREIDPPARLVYSHGWDDDSLGELFQAVITFTDHGGKTEVEMRSTFPTAAERDKVVKEFGAIEGGKQTLERLGEYLARQQGLADREAVTSRVLNAVPAEVYRAITTPELLAQWWGPQGFTNTFHECDIRPGGKWRLTMHGPDGKDYPNELEFVEVNPERIVIHHLATVHDFILAITLEPEGSGTRVGWRQRFESAEEFASCRHIVVPANEQNLDRMAAVVAASKV